MHRLRVLSALAAVLTASCAEFVTLSDVVDIGVANEEPADVQVTQLRTDVYRESDGQLVVQVFNDGREAVRDVELEIERVSRSGRRKTLGNASINRRIGPGSMDQTRTSVFIEKRELAQVEARVTSAERTD
jgi:hypothetical protein